MNLHHDCESSDGLSRWAHLNETDSPATAEDTQTDALTVAEIDDEALAIVALDETEGDGYDLNQSDDWLLTKETARPASIHSPY